MGLARTAVAAVLVVVAAACSGGDTASTPTSRPPQRTIGPAPGTLAGPGPMTGSPAAELPDPRTEVAGAAWQGRVAVAGGLDPDGGASSRLDTWDPATNTWTPGPDLPRGLHHAGLAVLGERLYVVGGYANAPGEPWTAQAGVFSLGPGEATWKPEPSLARARGALAVAALDGRLVAVGGVVGDQLSGSVESWAPGEQAWRGEPALAEPREHLGAASVGGRLYAVGGRRGGIDTNLASVESWAPGEATWTPEPSLARARGGIGVAAGTDRLCVAGGEEPSGTIAPVECIGVPGGAGWTVVAQMEVPRHGLALVALGDRLHAVGGGPDPGLFVSGAHEVFSAD